MNYVITMKYAVNILLYYWINWMAKQIDDILNKLISNQSKHCRTGEVLFKYLTRQTTLCIHLPNIPYKLIDSSLLISCIISDKWGIVLKFWLHNLNLEISLHWLKVFHCREMLIRTWNCTNCVQKWTVNELNSIDEWKNWWCPHKLIINCKVELLNLAKFLIFVHFA